jgi:transcriptional regulator with XRE-family HTH domain
VPDHGSPTVRRRQLAAEVHRLRERSGLTGDQAAERLGWSPSKISRIENMRSGIKLADARKLLDLFGVQGGQRDKLLALAHEAERKGWWVPYSADWPAEFTSYVGMEAEAESIRSWEPLVVPGLLQTEVYGREVIGNWQAFAAMPGAAIERRVDLRLARQQVLSRADPLQFSVVIDESVLRRRFGEKSAMHDQLSRLIEVSRLPNVRLTILPLSGYHPISTGAFSLLHFAQVHDISIPDVAFLENMTNSLYIEEEVELYYYQRAFEQITANSLGPAESRDLIAQVDREFWQ